MHMCVFMFVREFCMILAIVTHRTQPQQKQKQQQFTIENCKRFQLS